MFNNLNDQKGDKIDDIFAALMVGGRDSSGRD